MYADKSQWLLFILCGIITVVGYNFLLIKRDAKHIQTQPQSKQIIYKQLPVIPFTN